MFQSQIQMISDQNKQKQKEAEANGKPNPTLQQFFVPRKIRERFDDEFAKIAKNGSNSSSRHLRSTQKAASFALNNFAAKAVSNFFKDKKVYDKGYLIYDPDLVFTYAYDEMFNLQIIICS